MYTGAAFPEQLRIYSACPELPVSEPECYLERVATAARDAERAGHRGLLIGADARLVDPWLVAHAVVAATERLEPVVTVQPLYQHPYAAAKAMASIGALYQRPLSVVLVAGGFRHDLLALDDRTPHGERYARLREYGILMRRFLSSPDPVTFEGDHYRVFDQAMTPALPPSLRPRIFVAGSSDTCNGTVRELDAVQVLPAGTRDRLPEGRIGIRLGIVARADDDEAWQVARARFPVDRHGRLHQRLALRWTDSRWHLDLDCMARRGDGRGPYWMQPFECRRGSCPYLVGDHRTVAAELSHYLRLGIRDFLLDVDHGPEDLEHCAEAFRRAWMRSSRQLALAG